MPTNPLKFITADEQAEIRAKEGYGKGPTPIPLPPIGRERELLRRKIANTPAPLVEKFKTAEYEVLPPTSFDEEVAKMPSFQNDPNAQARYDLMKAQSTAESDRYRGMSSDERRQEGLDPQNRGESSFKEELPFTDYGKSNIPVDQVRWLMKDPDRRAELQLGRIYGGARGRPDFPPQINYFYQGGTRATADTTDPTTGRSSKLHELGHFLLTKPKGNRFASKFGPFDYETRLDASKVQPWYTRRGEFHADAVDRKIRDTVGPYIPPLVKYPSAYTRVGERPTAEKLIEHLRRRRGPNVYGRPNTRSLHEDTGAQRLLAEIRYRLRHHADWLARREKMNKAARSYKLHGGRAGVPRMSDEDVERIFQELINRPGDYKAEGFKKYRDSLTPEDQKKLDIQWKQIIRMAENQPPPSGMFYPPSQMTA